MVEYLKTKIGTAAKLPILSSNSVSTVVLLFVFRLHSSSGCSENCANA